MQSTAQGLGSTAEREQGIRSAIAATRGAVVLDQVGYDEGDITRATRQTQAELSRQPDLAGIFGTNLLSSEGVIAAVSAAHRAESLAIVSFDAWPKAITDLHEGLVDLIIAQQPERMGRLAVELAVQALTTTRPIPKRVQTGSVLITRENVDRPAVQAAISQDHE